MKSKTNHRRKQLICLAASATAALMLAPSLTSAGTTGTLVTISLSGSTAMRNFTISQGISYLDPNVGTIQLANGSFMVANDGSKLQLAPTQYPATAVDEANGLRIEWHEQGSVEGILELANDQIAPLTGLPNRNPSVANPVWVNRGSFTTAGSANGFTIGNFGALNGQNLVQLAISDVNARQGFSISGASGAWNAAPLTGSTPTAGYGKGNPALASGAVISGLGSAGVRQSLQDQSTLNMPSGTFGAGAWNNGGVANLDNKVVAVTATLFAANPGTGLTKINRKDAQWLQTAGRLSNGADFNMTERDPNSGTRNVAALNTGVDPSWAVGENDGGDGGAADGATAQVRVGSGIKFSGKTAGGGQLRPTVQNARMAVGVLGMSDAIGVVKSPTASVTPLRALKYADSNDDSGTFVQATADSITRGDYAIWQQETYVTVKNPNVGSFGSDTDAQWATRTDAETGIRGDNADHDVADFRANVLGSVKNFPGSATVANPADQLVATSFILPQMMWKSKALDGVGNSTPKTGDINTDSADYKHSLRDVLVSTASLNQNFNTADPSTITKGAAGAKYNGAGGGTTTAGDILLTATGANNAGGNWLFGNFNQTGVRDMSAVKAAVAAQAALFSSGAGVDANGGSSNSSAVAGLATPLSSMTGCDGTAGAKKGDLIVMGDYNADGKFNGRDLYLLARGAALADNTGVETLSGGATAFGDKIRTGVLRKNATLDYMNTNATAQQKLDASANLTNDAGGANAFNKFDVNRDGLINRNDAAVVDKFVGKDYRNLDNQLAATIASDGSVNPALPQATISLVDVELNDTGDIALSSDFAMVRAAVGIQLRDGDANFDGQVNTADFNVLATSFNQAGHKWSEGDFNFDGVVNALDFNALVTNYGLPPTAPGLGSLVPEPGSTAALLAACGLAISRSSRRRRRTTR